MADHIDITEGSGKTVATDDVGGKQYQRVKIDLGTDGAAAPALAGAGAVAIGVQRITLASDDPAVALLGTIDTDTGVIAGDTTSIDGKITACNTGAVVISSGTVTTVSTVTTCSTVTAVTSLDKAVYVDDADWTDNTSSHTLVGGVYQSSPHTVTDGDVSPFGVDVNGNIVLGTSDKAIGKLAANSGVDIGDVDVTSIVPGVAATSLGKARDSALGATDTGVMALAVRDDTLTTLTPADGDYVPLRVSSTGQLHVTGAGGGTEYTEDVTTANPQVGSAILMERDDALTTVTPVEGDWIGLRGTAEGALWVQDFNSDAILSDTNAMVTDLAAIEVLLGTIDTDTGVIAGDTTSIDGKITACDTGAVVLATGSAAIGKLAANSGVDIGDVDVTSIVPGTGNTNLGKAEDLAHNSGDTGVMALTVRKNSAGATSGSDNDYQPLITDTNGRLHVLDANTANMLTALQIIDDWDAVHDSAASSDGPQVIAAYDSTKPAAVGDGDAVRILADAYGRLLAGVEPQAFQAVFDSGDASGEGEQVHASAASTIIVVQSYIISSDAEIWVKLQDEASTALTGKFYLKAGGGVAITLPDKAPIVLGVDKDLEVITEGAGSISVSVTGYTIPG